ncbi:MAG TPA: AsmA family protein [Burkholderiaceae bacterium]|nr:AsmA family protein [Burkholderiaceae bacterium]
MTRATRWLLWAAAGLIGVLLVLIVIIATFDWNRLRPWVEEKAGDALQRPVSIQGDLDVDWQWRSGWLPWPHISGHDIVVAHPEGFAGTGEHMARIDYLGLSVNPLPLLKRHVEIPRLEIGQSRVFLQRNQQEQTNWIYQRRKKDNDDKQGWTVDLQSIALKRVDLQVVDEMRKLDMTTRFNSLDTDEGGYGMDWESSGTYNETEVGGSGKVGGLLSLRDGSKPFPMQGEVSFGETRIAVEGSMSVPKGLASVDVRLKLAGSSLADLNALFGLALPGTPPFVTEGRLLGMLEGEEDRWRYEDFTGTVGDSDLRGTVEYRVGPERPLLVGELASDLLHFRDLGPLIGADTSRKDVPDRPKRDDDAERRAQPKGKVLPVARIGSETWELMDADVKFKGKRIVQNENLPLDDIEAHVLLKDRVLSFEPLNFGVAGGTLSNTIHIDGRGEVLQGEMVTEARGLKLKQLFPGAESMNASFGQLHGNAKLKGAGDSIASLLGSSSGNLSLALSRGTISRFLMEAAGLNVANVIFVKLFGDEQVMLECLVADFSVNNGVMKTRAFVLETEDAVVTMEGVISLKKETLDLDIKPQNKTLRIFTLRSPLYAKGTFKNPDVGVQAAPVAARAGAAIALGVVATPLAALVPLLNVGTGDEGECASVRGKKK